MAQHALTVHGTVTQLKGDGDCVLVVMKDKGVRVHRPDDRDREWPVKAGCQITDVASHKFGNVVAQKRYTAAIHPDHLVTWSAGFDKALHLAPGIHVGAEVTHIATPLPSPEQAFLRTQAVAVLCKGASWIHIFNPYTTELAGPIEDPIKDGVAGEEGKVVWAACGAEQNGEWYPLYVIRSEEPGVVRGYRVSPRSFKVTALGKFAVGEHAAIHLDAGYWVVVGGDGVVKHAKVTEEDPKFATTPNCPKISIKEGKVCVSFVDESVVSIATVGQGVVKVQGVDLTYGTKSGQTRTFSPLENTHTIGNLNTLYTTVKGQHWVSVNDKIYTEEAEVGSKTLAAAMLRAVEGDETPVIVKLGDVDGTEEMVKKMKSTKGKGKKEKKPTTVAEAEKVQTNLASAACVKKCFEVAMKFNNSSLIEKLVKDPGFVVSEQICPGLLQHLAKKKETKLLRTTCRAMAGVIDTKTTCEVLQTVWGRVKKVNREVMSITDSILTAGRLPDPVDIGIDFSDCLTAATKTLLLEYFYLRFVVRTEHPNPPALTAAGIPTPETLSHYLGALFDGCADEFANDTSYHTLLSKIYELTSRALSVAHRSATLPGEMSVYVGTEARRDTGLVDIDSKELTPGPLRQRSSHVAQPIARYSLVF